MPSSPVLRAPRPAALPSLAPLVKAAKRAARYFPLLALDRAFQALFTQGLRAVRDFEGALCDIPKGQLLEVASGTYDGARGAPSRMGALRTYRQAGRARVYLHRGGTILLVAVFDTGYSTIGEEHLEDVWAAPIAPTDLPRLTLSMASGRTVAGAGAVRDHLITLLEQGIARTDGTVADARRRADELAAQLEAAKRRDPVLRAAARAQRA